MSQLLTDDSLDALQMAGAPRRMSCESLLRVAAATLSDAPTGALTATRALCALGQDDADTFRALLAQITAEHHLSAAVRMTDGWVTVRFTRASNPSAP